MQETQSKNPSGTCACYPIKKLHKWLLSNAFKIQKYLYEDEATNTTTICKYTGKMFIITTVKHAICSHPYLYPHPITVTYILTHILTYILAPPPLPISSPLPISLPHHLYLYPCPTTLTYFLTPPPFNYILTSLPLPISSPHYPYLHPCPTTFPISSPHHSYLYPHPITLIPTSLPHHPYLYPHPTTLTYILTPPPLPISSPHYPYLHPYPTILTYIPHHYLNKVRCHLSSFSS